MSLKTCMTARGLGAELRNGLKALGAHSVRVQVATSFKASHSIDLDAALRSQQPKASRWDYGVGLQRGSQERIAWVEVHPATSGEVEAVLNKLAWLKRWLAQAADSCCSTESSYHWVATDAGVHIDTARRRRLNAAGLQMPQSRLRL